MRNLSLVAAFCVLVALVGGQQAPEDEEVDQFVQALCTPKVAEGLANCGELFLPQRGKEIVYRCTRGLQRNARNNMLYAAGTFCNREDVRDPLFRCWESDLTQLYDNTQDENERKDINNFQACLQRVLDVLFDGEEAGSQRN